MLKFLFNFSVFPLVHPDFIHKMEFVSRVILIVIIVLEMLVISVCLVIQDFYLLFQL
jgi:hypothetical protein